MAYLGCLDHRRFSAISKIFGVESCRKPGQRQGQICQQTSQSFQVSIRFPLNHSIDWINVGYYRDLPGEPKTCEHVVSLLKNIVFIYMFLFQTRSSKFMFFHVLKIWFKNVAHCHDRSNTHTQLPYLTHFCYWPIKTALAHIWLTGLYITNAFSFLMGKIRVSKNLVLECSWGVPKNASLVRIHIIDYLNQNCSFWKGPAFSPLVCFLGSRQSSIDTSLYVHLNRSNDPAISE